MKVRIKFSKQGPVKFIGHLDVMRYFQKAIRRAGIDIKYSEGFSPHQIMSFAAPLGLGLTSNGEYMDIEVNSMSSCETMVKQLNAVMVEGIEVLECHKLEDNAKNAMSIVAAADYTLTFREGKAPEDLEAFFAGLKEFYQRCPLCCFDGTFCDGRNLSQESKAKSYCLHKINRFIIIDLLLFLK